MSDLFERIGRIIRKTNVTNLATVTEDGKPWVR